MVDYLGEELLAGLGELGGYISSEDPQRCSLSSSFDLSVASRRRKSSTAWVGRPTNRPFTGPLAGRSFYGTIGCFAAGCVVPG